MYGINNLSNICLASELYKDTFLEKKKICWNTATLIDRLSALFIFIYVNFVAVIIVDHNKGSYLDLLQYDFNSIIM